MKNCFGARAGTADSLSGRVVELVLPGATEAGLDSSVLPQPLDDAGQLARHEPLLSRPRQHKQLPRIVLPGKTTAPRI